MSRYAWRTDAASGTVIASSIDAAVAQLVAEREWAALDSAQEQRDIADGAWLLVRSDDEEYRRGVVP